MTMVKIASASDWEYLSNIIPVEVKISSRGFLRSDQVKIASEVGDRFIHEVRQIEDQLDRTNHKYAHIISCGATSKTGCNRNGDGWSAEALARDMPTYVKHARFYRDHVNKSDSPAYGHVKLAFYDADRGYGRLLAALNATSKIAYERKEHVADLELDALDKLGEFRVSHGTTVGSDTCAHCGNVAKKRSEYCLGKHEGGNCPLFGCRNGMSKVSDDGRIQYVDNPKNVFYDISSIGLTPYSANQADRVAFASLFDTDLSKYSSEQGGVMGSAWLAEQMGIRPRLDFYDFSALTPYHERLAKTAIMLAEAEQLGNPIVTLVADSRAKLSQLHSDIPSVRRGAVKSLVQRGEMPGPYSFAKTAGLSDADAAAVCVLSDNLLSKFADDDMISTLIQQSDFTASPSISEMVDCRAPSCSLNASDINRRMKVAAAIGRPAEVAASATHGNMLLAKHAADYAAMKVLYASQIFGTDQNRVNLIANVRKG